MRAGIVLPQGWIETFPGSSAAADWERAVGAAKATERLGFESGWFYDHFHRWPRANLDPVFESFTGLTGIAAVTSRIRLGHLVICAGFRNPAVVAKMASTIDVISRGRFDLGIGAGWYLDEWHAYGFDFPERSVRLATLGDHLEVIAHMLRPGPATYIGKYARVEGAVNEPQPLQQRLPIMVGGNGPNVTWRLAARFADEVNLDGLSPQQTREALPVIAARCEEIARDPASLRVSVHVFIDGFGPHGAQRTDQLGAYAALGISRIMTPPPGLSRSDEVLEELAEDCTAAGVELSPALQ